jgi:hypothetical protein
MSRYILKNIPRWIDEKGVFFFFSRFGKITDIKIIQNKHEKACFIGFFNKICLNNLEKFLKNSFLGKISELKQEIGVTNHIKIPVEKTYISWRSENKFSCGRKVILLIDNLPSACCYLDLEKLLKPFGFFFCLEFSKREKRFNDVKFARISYAFPEASIKAACFLDGKIFKGKILKINNFYLNQNIHSDLNVSFFDTYKNLKENKEKMVKKYQWVKILGPSDDVIEKVSTRFDLKKEKSYYFDKKNYSISKKLIMDTRLQSEALFLMKKEGLDLDSNSYNSNFRISGKKFYVKNLPVKNQKFLDIYFKKFGKLVDLRLFSSFNLLIVEYKKKSDAKISFESIMKICSRRNKIVYGWMPLKIKVVSGNNFVSKNLLNIKKNLCKLESEFNKSNFGRANINRPVYKKKYFGKNFLEIENRNIHKKPIGKILIRNLPFNCCMDDLRKIFNSLSNILSIRIPKKNSFQIKGFAFIEFESIEEAKKVLLVSQNILLFSRRLYLSLLI